MPKVHKNYLCSHWGMGCNRDIGRYDFSTSHKRNPNPQSLAAINKAHAEAEAWLKVSKRKALLTDHNCICTSSNRDWGFPNVRTRNPKSCSFCVQVWKEDVIQWRAHLPHILFLRKLEVKKEFVVERDKESRIETLLSARTGRWFRVLDR